MDPVSRGEVDELRNDSQKTEEMWTISRCLRVYLSLYPFAIYKGRAGRAVRFCKRDSDGAMLVIEAGPCHAFIRLGNTY
jgi:hypothetical protein